MVSPTPSLGHQTPIGFVVLRFHGFVVSSTPSLGQQEADRFHGFVVSWFHPLHLWDIEMTIDFMVSSSQCPRDEVGETMKLRNHETYRHLDVQRWSARIHETTKTRNPETCRLLAIQRWSGQNHETTKLQNHETHRHFDVSEMEWTKPWNHETMKPIGFLLCQWKKPWNLSSFRCLRDGVDETMKPRNHETYCHFQRWIWRNHETYRYFAVP